MSDLTEIRAQAVDFGNRIEVMIAHRLSGDRLAAGTVTFKEVPEGGYVESAVALRIPDAQRLMDDLWRCGLRPTEGKGSAGSLAATEAHLQDMRTLVFHALNVEQKAAAR